MTEPRPQPGDRVRVTYEATVSSTGRGGISVVLPCSDPVAQYHAVLPPHATVEILQPPTLAERMAALAEELESNPGYGGYCDGISAAVKRIREELAAAEREQP